VHLIDLFLIITIGGVEKRGEIITIEKREKIGLYLSYESLWIKIAYLLIQNIV
jgi:hypothetical protein